MCYCTFIIQLMMRIYGATHWVTGGLLPSGMCHCLSHHAWSNAVAYVIVSNMLLSKSLCSICDFGAPRKWQN